MPRRYKPVTGPDTERSYNAAGAFAAKINAALTAAGYRPVKHTYRETTFMRGDSVVVVPGQKNPRVRWSYAEWGKFVREYGLTIHQEGRILKMEATKQP